MSGKLDRERLLRNVVDLRCAELQGSPEVVGDVRDDLERLIGPTVSRALAARALGISQTALDRHVGSGSLAAVETPSGRLEVPIGELVSLAVELRSHTGDRHPVAAVLDARRARAKTLTRARLLPELRASARGHRQAELRSLVFHRVIADRLDHQLAQDAKRRLRRWRADDRIDPHWDERWSDVLDQPLAEIRRIITTDDEHAADLRQSSPFAGSLSEPERRRVVELVREAA